MRKSKWPVMWMLAFVLGVGACVSSPPQVVELSDVTLEQLTYIEKSHRDLVRAYFAQLELRVNEFIDNQWVPNFLNRAVQNADVQAALHSIHSGLDIDPKDLKASLSESGRYTDTEAQIIVDALDMSKIEQRVRLSQFMFDFTEAAMTEINRIRSEWHERLRKSERRFMVELDESYSTVRSGHAQIRAYLESVVEITQLQNEIAEKLRVIATRDEALNEIAQFSESLAGGAQALEQALEEVEKHNMDSNHPSPSDAPVLNRILKTIDTGSKRDSDPDDAPPLSDAEMNQVLKELEEN